MRLRKDYSTIVFNNGNIIMFRLRDENRFKVSLIVPSALCTIGIEIITSFTNQYHIDIDDCNVEEFGRFVSYMQNT